LKKIPKNSRGQFVLKIAQKSQKLKKKVFLKFIAKVTKSVDFAQNLLLQITL